MKQGFYALRWADLQFLEQNSVDKFLLDQSHFMVKFFSEWLEYLLTIESQMFFMTFLLSQDYWYSGKK